MQVMAIAGMAMSAISAIGQIQAGRAQEAQYKAMANQAEFEGRSDAIKWKQEGNKSLEQLLEANASINAAAGAGSVDLSGSASVVQQRNTRRAMTDYHMAYRNAQQAVSMGQFQGGLYRQAGKTARKAGIYNAIGTLGSAAMSGAQSGAFGTFGGSPAGYNAATGSTSVSRSLSRSGNLYQRAG